MEDNGDLRRNRAVSRGRERAARRFCFVFVLFFKETFPRLESRLLLLSFARTM